MPGGRLLGKFGIHAQCYAKLCGLPSPLMLSPSSSVAEEWGSVTSSLPDVPIEIVQHHAIFIISTIGYVQWLGRELSLVDGAA